MADIAERAPEGFAVAPYACGLLHVITVGMEQVDGFSMPRAPCRRWCKESPQPVHA